MLLDRFYHLIGRYGVGVQKNVPHKSLTQRDALLITYADMVSEEGNARCCLEGILYGPPEGRLFGNPYTALLSWTSDDGFSVVDYREVDERYGRWDDVAKFSEEFELMFDLVLNHCSAKSPWFKEYVSGIEPGRNYIMEADEKADLSAVVRPRSTPLLTTFQTRGGERNVWTTFGADQVDLDWTSLGPSSSSSLTLSCSTSRWVAGFCVWMRLHFSGRKSARPVSIFPRRTKS